MVTTNGNFTFADPEDLERLKQEGGFLFKVMCNLRTIILNQIEQTQLSKEGILRIEAILRQPQYDFQNERPTNNPSAVVELNTIIDNLKEFGEEYQLLPADYDPYSTPMEEELKHESFERRSLK